MIKSSKGTVDRLMIQQSLPFFMMTKLQALRTNNCKNIKRLNNERFYLMKNMPMHNCKM